jgi:5-formyltetrahydrofolate cyclo-ligase
MNLIQLRQSLRDQRKKLSAEIVSAASASIAKKIMTLPEFLNSEHIAFYFSNENEIDPAQIVRHAEQHNKKIYFPVLDNQNLLFYRVDQHTQYEKNQFGILEPIFDKKDLSPIEKIELFFIPLVAFIMIVH